MVFRLWFFVLCEGRKIEIGVGEEMGVGSKIEGEKVKI